MDVVLVASLTKIDTFLKVECGSNLKKCAYLQTKVWPDWRQKHSQLPVYLEINMTLLNE